MIELKTKTQQIMSGAVSTIVGQAFEVMSSFVGMYTESFSSMDKRLERIEKSLANIEKSLAPVGWYKPQEEGVVPHVPEPVSDSELGSKTETEPEPEQYEGKEESEEFPEKTFQEDTGPEPSPEYVDPEKLAPREFMILKGLQHIATEGENGNLEVEGLSNMVLTQRFRTYIGPVTRGSVSATLSRLRRKGVIDVTWREENPHDRVISILAQIKPEDLGEPSVDLSYN